MADETKNTDLISKRNSGYPEYLDFEKLRREGIGYLGSLSGQIWTDHNVHDPGITILEVLCYALLDLGYRTNLPAGDIFARKPGETSKDDNFFTPAEILSCNPLTIVDYRKLLMDIEGVKNAWLEPALKIKDPCITSNEEPVSTYNENPGNESGCTEFLNGLYHVYLETEEDPDTFFKTDEIKKEFLDGVKNSLISHRNLCEDFVDITVLCKQQIGICADIELEDGTDAEKVYLELVEKLREFLSPAPKFYTLKQLLDKNKPIEEIFAGRPHNVISSHGFIDNDELLQIKLKKEIHVSDVYSAIMEITGIRRVRNLQLRSCDEGDNCTKNTKWKFILRKNHVSDFSLSCSGFRFFKNEIPVFVDTKKFEGMFSINFKHLGKILYKAPSPYLDCEIPKGTYYPELAEYNPLEGDFPRVYGIAPGGLSDKAPQQRKSQALQLKGYLLFFDQLLANYLAQLKNIRTLFAMSSGNDAEKNHTYFFSRMENLPDANSLLRFAANEGDSGSLGKAGTVVAYPVSKDDLITVLSADSSVLHGDKHNPLPDAHKFDTFDIQSSAISELKENFYNGHFEYGYLNQESNCIYYYITTASDDIALISMKSFQSLKEAKENLDSLKYIGVFDENYRTFITGDYKISFDIELTIESYAKYLQLIVEDNDLYIKRRNEFLDHLLSRFAERFTDFALLSYSKLTYKMSSGQFDSNNIKAKEDFLSHYDSISSNRGRAFNYLKNKWNTYNNSGFENEVKYLIGAESKKTHHLCNYTVERYDEQYVIKLNIAGKEITALNEKFYSRTDALNTAREVFNALANKENITPVHIPHERHYRNEVNFGAKKTALLSGSYGSPVEADIAGKNLSRLFQSKPNGNEVVISEYIYRMQLKDAESNPVRTASEFQFTPEDSFKYSGKLVPGINEEKLWLRENGGKSNPVKLHLNRFRTPEMRFVDTGQFKIDINNTILGMPMKFTYDLLNKFNSFKLRPAKFFDSPEEAENHCFDVIALLADIDNFRVSRDNSSGMYALHITGSGGEPEASSYIEFGSEEEAFLESEKIQKIVSQAEYRLSVSKIPYRWKFRFPLGYKTEEQFIFESSKDFAAPEEAFRAAELFHEAIPSVKLQEKKSRPLALVTAKNKNIPALNLIYTAEESTRLKDVQVLKTADSPKEINRPNPKLLIEEQLKLQKEIVSLKSTESPEAFRNSVQVDDISRQGLYVYRLVDKDRVPAFYEKEFTNRTDAENERKSIAGSLKSGMSFLEICLGGDIIVQTGEGYRYRIQCRNRAYQTGELKGSELVLFESTAVFDSYELANDAFLKDYLYILDKAEDVNNYGTVISLEEITVNMKDACSGNVSIVYIPNHTRTEFAGGAGTLPDKISEIVKQYPIKSVEYNSKEFCELFCCEDIPADDTNETCRSEKDIRYVYYFRLAPGITQKYSWRSLRYYDSPKEALYDFYFFVMLLDYPGNLYIDCDDCGSEVTAKFRIYIREVLAESFNRYPDAASAWGKEGVEKFICAVQSGTAFHNYLRKKDCCYSFYVNCGEEIVIHPCKYDTSVKRDKVLAELYIGFSEFIKRNAYQYKAEKNILILSDGQGKPLAKHISQGYGSEKDCEMLFELFAKINSSGTTFRENTDSIELIGSDGGIILQSIGKTHTIAEWRKELASFLCNYPVTVSKNEKTGKLSYCIELKFGGFNLCSDDNSREQPYGCDDKPVVEPDCYTAWISTCCYEDCGDAHSALEHIKKLLINFDNYRPVFDCSCNSFGIALQNKEFIRSSRESSDYRIVTGGELIAYNPQCYITPQMVCDAVKRAELLTNAEGLHLVEHILLRPHCEGDCDCREELYCTNRHDCRFKWIVPQDDPCSEEENICFVPGADPYSFIATVALPAWPLRFRTPEGRKLLESMLYRSAPAHVLLRILWLAPHDFCCFESKYKNWRKWLAKKAPCSNFSVCDFLEFLFSRNFECLNECIDCRPCLEEEQKNDPCSFANSEMQEDTPERFVNEINEIYCWDKIECGEYEFVECDKAIIDTSHVRYRPPAAEAAELPPLTAEKAIVHEMKKKPEVMKEAQIANRRLSIYKTASEIITQNSGNNHLASKTQIFLKVREPSAKKTGDLITEVIKNKNTSKKSQALDAEQVQELVKCIVCSYLDKLCFGKKDTGEARKLDKVFIRIRKSGINTSEIYKFWNEREVNKYAPGADTDKVKNLLKVK